MSEKFQRMTNPESTKTKLLNNRNMQSMFFIKMLITAAFSQIDVLKYLLFRLIRCNIGFLIRPLSALILDNVLRRPFIHTNKSTDLIKPLMISIMFCSLKVCMKWKLQPNLHFRLKCYQFFFPCSNFIHCLLTAS